MRVKVWKKLDQGRKDPVILDFDASLVDVHSEQKEKAAPSYKGGFGFHPLFVFSDLTGETLAAKLRAGNATAKSASDHVELLDAALGQLPSAIAGRLAFAWLLARPAVASVIAGASNRMQFGENSEATTWKLSDQEIAEIEAIAESV